ncbi:TPA: hypothetical protein OL424_001390 [Clostridioides difficile]|nr:hypothetical protein [Clostridioides difficile]
MTNFEMIKNMSKKELAEFINEIGDNCTCIYCSCRYRYEICDVDEKCVDGCKEWLDMEVEL